TRDREHLTRGSVLRVALSGARRGRADAEHVLLSGGAHLERALGLVEAEIGEPGRGHLAEGAQRRERRELLDEIARGLHADERELLSGVLGRRGGGYRRMPVRHLLLHAGDVVPARLVLLRFEAHLSVFRLV